MSRHISLTLTIGSADERRCGSVGEYSLNALSWCPHLDDRGNCRLFGKLDRELSGVEDYKVPLRHPKCIAAEVGDTP